MEKVLTKAAVLMLSLWLLAAIPSAEATWRLDENPELAEPRNFRMASDDWSTEPEDEPPTREGLDELRASGSAQPTAAGFAALYATLSGAAAGAPVYDVDLRQESHGFADGLPVSWYEERNQANAGKTPEEVARDEAERLAGLAGEETVFSPEEKKDRKRFGEMTFTPLNVQTEKETVEAIGFRYARFYVTDRSEPDTETVEAFLAFVESLPKDAWVHFHCRAGHGRTTSFMAMYDMIRNPEVPAEEIIERQYLIGGSDLTAMKKDAWRNEQIVLRLEMLHNFSRYVRARSAGETSLPWGAWVEEEAGAA